MKQLIEIYHKIEGDIKKRLSEFNSVWINSDEKRLFQELAFCILTPQSKAENAWKIITDLSENNMLFQSNAESLAKEMNLVRFKNNKANYVVKAREYFLDNSISIKKTLQKFPDVLEKRNWLNKNIKGYGLKESSHFLRNIGFAKEITILDRHILRNLVNNKIIDEIPKSISEKKYFEIENSMKKFSEKINIPLEYLDFVLWYKETKRIFK